MNIIIDIINQINSMNIAWRYIIAMIFYILSLICLNISGACIQAVQVADHLEDTTIMITTILVQSITMLMFFITVFLVQENQYNILQNLKTNITSLAIYIIYVIFNLFANILYVYILGADQCPLYILIFTSLIRVVFSCFTSIYNDKNINVNQIYLNIGQIILYIVLYGFMIILSPKQQYISIFWSIVYGFTLFVVELIFQTEIEGNTTKLADALGIIKPDIINFNFYSNLITMVMSIFYIIYNFLLKTTNENHVISNIYNTLILNKELWIIIAILITIATLSNSFASYLTPIYILQSFNIIPVVMLIANNIILSSNYPYIKINGNIATYIIYDIIILVIISIIRVIIEINSSKEDRQVD